MNKKRAALATVLTGVGVCLLVLAGIFSLIFDKIMKDELTQKLSLREGTVGFKMWKKPPVPVSFQIYVFDIKNPEEVSQGMPPRVVEKGPYVYRLSVEKKNIVRHDGNSTISYTQPQSFVFDSELSVGPMTDTFTTYNIPFVTIAKSLQHWPDFIQQTVDALMKVEKEKAFKTLTINDIFWGYDDPLLHKAYELLKKFHISFPFLQSKFGFFADKNNSDDGNYTVFSSVDGDLSDYCLIESWNQKRKLDIWETPEANAITGSDGSLHPPYITKDSKLRIFDAYLQRSLHLDYTKETSYKGLDTLHFVVPFSDFANASVNPNNAGFCTPNPDFCIPSGCINLTVASFGSPLYVSLPHFCGGDPYYQQQVLGLNPRPEDHQPFYDIHALTGVTIKGARKYQIVLRGEPFKHFSELRNFPVAYLPIIWIDGLSVIDNHNVALFRDDIQGLVRAVPYIRGAMIGVGVVLLLAVCLLAVYWYKKNKEHERAIAALIKDKENGQPRLAPSNRNHAVNDNTDPDQAERAPLLGKT